MAVKTIWGYFYYYYLMGIVLKSCHTAIESAFSSTGMIKS